jgi:hypothetical protein
MESSWWVHDGNASIYCLHISSYLLFLLGIPVGRAETPNFFMIKHAIGGFPWQ